MSPSMKMNRPIHGSQGCCVARPTPPTTIPSPASCACLNRAFCSRFIPDAASADDGACRQFFIRTHQNHPVSLLGAENHALTHLSGHFARRKIGDNDHLSANHVLRRLVLGNAGKNLAGFRSKIHLVLQKLF